MVKAVLLVISCSMRKDQEISVGVSKFGCTPPGTNLAAAGTGADVDNGNCDTCALARL